MQTVSFPYKMRSASVAREGEKRNFTNFTSGCLGQVSSNTSACRVPLGRPTKCLHCGNREQPKKSEELSLLALSLSTPSPQPGQPVREVCCCCTFEFLFSLVSYSKASAGSLGNGWLKLAWKSSASSASVSSLSPVVKNYIILSFRSATNLNNFSISVRQLASTWDFCLAPLDTSFPQAGEEGQDIPGSFQGICLLMGSVS